MPIAMLAAGIALERIVAVPAQFAHALFGRIVRPDDPPFQIVKLLAMTLLFREVREQYFLFPRRQLLEALREPLVRFVLDRRERGDKFSLMLVRIHTHQQIDEPVYVRGRGAWYHYFRKSGKRLVLPSVQK